MNIFKLRLLILIFLSSAVRGQAQELKSLLYNIEHTTSDTQKTTAYRKVIKYYKKENMDSAVLYAEQYLQIAIAKKDLYGEAQMMEEMGKIDQLQGRMEIAKQRINYALKLYTELDRPRNIAGMYNTLGAMDATVGNSDPAIQYFIKALKIYDSVKVDIEGTMTTNMNLGCLYLQNGDTTLASKYLDKAEEASKKIPVLDATISLYNYIGVLYAVKGNLKKALEYFINDVKISEGPDYVSAHVESLLYLGNFYSDMGDPKNAMEYLNKGLAIATEKKLIESQADILLQIGILNKKTDPALAMKYMKEALAICEGMRSKTLKADIYKEMSATYELQGNYKEALAVTKLQHVIRDSIFKVNKMKELAGLGATYELEKSNNRVKELEYLYKQIAGQRNIIIGVSITVILALITMVVLYFKQET